jgi:hypothetical protein
MFLKFIKDFGLKKIINKSLAQYKLVPSQNAVKTVGILIDETYFTDKGAFAEELIVNGIKEADITILIYKNRITKKEAKVIDYPYFTYKDVTATGHFTKEEIASFINAPFDMLISYYDIEKSPLLLATIQSKAKFKVGFGSVDKRINNFMITTVAEKYKEFTAELFKYLKILNKI